MAPRLADLFAIGQLRLPCSTAPKGPAGFARQVLEDELESIDNSKIQQNVFASNASVN